MAICPPFVAAAVLAAAFSSFLVACGCGEGEGSARDRRWLIDEGDHLVGEAQQVADLFQEQFFEATAGVGTSWASQPGALIVFKGSQRVRRHRLYSHPERVAGGEIDLRDDIPVDWRGQPARFVDLNEGVVPNGSRPILDTGEPFPVHWMYKFGDGTIAFLDAAGEFRDREGAIVADRPSPELRLAYWVDDEASKVHSPERAAGDTWWFTARGRSPETTLYGTPRWSCVPSQRYLGTRFPDVSVAADVLPQLALQFSTPHGGPLSPSAHQDGSWLPHSALMVWQLVGNIRPEGREGFLDVIGKYGRGPYGDGSQLLVSALSATGSPIFQTIGAGDPDEPVPRTLQPLCGCGGLGPHSARWDKPFLKFPMGVGRAVTIAEVAFVFRCVARRDSTDRGVGEGWEKLEVGGRLVEAALLIDVVVPSHHPRPFIPEGSISIVGGRVGLDRPPPQLMLDDRSLGQLATMRVENTPGVSVEGGRAGVRLFSRASGDGAAMVWSNKIAIPGGAKTMKFRVKGGHGEHLRFVLSARRGSPNPASIYQLFALRVPAVDLPIPDFDAARGQLSFEQRLGNPDGPCVLDSDVVRSMRPPHVDYRIVASRRYHGPAGMVPHPGYFDATVRHAHSLADLGDPDRDGGWREGGDWSRADDGIEGSFVVWEGGSVASQLAVIGQIPTGAQSQTPYRTLLLRPQDGHPGAAGPPDHLLLDFLWQPEPNKHGPAQWSHGKLNLNAEIVPFGIERHEGLRAVIDGLRLGDQEGEAGAYRPDVEATLAGWQAAALTQRGFRTSSEVCELPIVWRGGNGEAPDLESLPENFRERPYVDLYRKTTARSQSYLAHVVVERLSGEGAGSGSKPIRWTGRLWLERELTLPAEGDGKLALDTNLERSYRVSVTAVEQLRENGWRESGGACLE